MTAGQLSGDDALAWLARAAQGQPLGLYTSRAFLAFLQQVVPGCSTHWLSVQGSKGVLGLMPVLLARAGTWRVGNSMPFYGSHGGPIVQPGLMPAESQAVQAALWQALDQWAVQQGCAAVTVVEHLFRPINAEAAAFVGYTAIDERLGMVKPLSVHMNRESVLACCHLKLRNAIRKGDRLGLQVREANDTATLQWLQRVHEASISAMGGRAKPWPVFQLLADHLPLGQSCRVFVACQGAQPVAAVLMLVTDRVTAEYFTPVVEPGFRDQQALPSLLATVMAQLAAEGFAWWNWGGTWPSQEGVYRFKQRWGGEERPYRYFAKLYQPALKAVPMAELQALFPYSYLFKY